MIFLIDCQRKHNFNPRKLLFLKRRITQLRYVFIRITKNCYLVILVYSYWLYWSL